MKATVFSGFFCKAMLLVVIVALGCLNVSFAQLNISDAHHFKAKATTQIVIKNMDFANNGTLTLAANSTVIMRGNAEQMIKGAGAIAFSNLTIDNTAGVSLDQDISTSGTLLMSQGDLDLKNKILDIGTTGTISGESNDKRIKVTPVLTGGNDGRIKATRTLVSGNNANANLGNIGIDIYSTSYTGIKTIYRGNQQLTGSYGGDPVNSALRYFILPDFGQQTNNNRITMYYFPNECNGIEEENLCLFQKITQDPDTWFTPVSSAQTTGPPGYVATDNVECPYHQYVCDRIPHITFTNLFTLGGSGSDTPLAIELLSFSAKCEQKSIRLDWTTATENNNSHFIIEKSTDGLTWNYVAAINGAGTVNQIQNYNYSDNEIVENTEYYYRIADVDFDGTIHYSPVISILCYTENEGLLVYPNPAKTELTIQIMSPQETDIYYYMTDVFGRTVLKENTFSHQGINTIQVNISDLSDAVYMLYVSTGTKQAIRVKQVIIKK